MFEAFYRAVYTISLGVTELNQMGYEKLVVWLRGRFKDYDPFAQQYFLHGFKNEFAFGDAIVKNLLNQDRNSQASFESSS